MLATKEATLSMGNILRAALMQNCDYDGEKVQYIFLLKCLSHFHLKIIKNCIKSGKGGDLQKIKTTS